MSDQRARMPSKRWVEMVETMQPFCCEDDTEAINPVVFVSDAATLLSRQHARFVRLVTEASTHGPNFRGGMVPCEDGEWINVNDLLTALQQRGKK